MISFTRLIGDTLAAWGTYFEYRLPRNKIFAVVLTSNFEESKIDVPSSISHSHRNKSCGNGLRDLNFFALEISRVWEWPFDLDQNRVVTNNSQKTFVKRPRYDRTRFFFMSCVLKSETTAKRSGSDRNNSSVQLSWFDTNYTSNCP